MVSDFVANFSLNSYEVAVAADPADGGTVTGAGTYEYGTSVTVEVTLNPNYNFDNWTLNGTVVSEELAYTFVVTEDCELVAHLTFFDEIEDNEAAILIMYPNPAKDKINLSGMAVKSVMVFNTMGQLVIAKECDNAENVELDLGGLGSGIYNISVNTAQGIRINKAFIKE